MVVAPNTVHRQWAEEEVPKHCSVPYITLVWSATKSKTQKFKREKMEFDKSDKLKIFCVNVEAFSSKTYQHIFKKFLEENKTLMIVDESTVIKNVKANRTQFILLISDLPHRKLILTGTPVTNGPFDLWAQFEFLKSWFWKCNYFMFRHRYGLLIKEKKEDTGKKKDTTRPMQPWEITRCRKRVDYYRKPHKELRGDVEIDADSYDLDEAVEAVANESGISEKTVYYIATHDDIRHPYKGLEKIKKMIEPHSYTIRKRDCNDIRIPDKIYESIYVEMSTEQKRVYKEAKKLMLAQYGDKILSVQNKLSLMIRLQQIVGGFFPYDPDPETGEKPKPVLIGTETAKFKRLKQDLEQVYDDEKIIIWSRFTAEIEYLHKELKKMFPYERVETYYGGTAKGDREEIIDSFKKGDIRFLIANPKSAGIGLNLQKSSLHYFYSNDFSLEKRLQAEDRSHRIGQKNHLVIKDIIIKGTIDEKIATSLISKKEILDYFRDKSLKELLEEGELF